MNDVAEKLDAHKGDLKEESQKAPPNTTPDEKLNDAEGDSGVSQMEGGDEGESHLGQEGTSQPPRSIEDVKAEVEGLKKELADIKEAKETLIARLRRAQADFQNLKRRSELEKEEMVKFALADFIKNILPVVDNLERAIAAGESATTSSDLLEGVKLVYRQFRDILEKEGLTPIDAVGKPFDPFQHEALSYEETDEYPDGVVMEELLKGYEFGGKVIRHTLVKVAKGKS